MDACAHAWECCDDQWVRCGRCGQERNTLEGTVTLHDPDDPSAGLWVTSIDAADHLGRLLAPFIDRRVRITVETID